MSRRYLIIVSVAAHAALGIGIFISGIWKIERLDYQHRAPLSLGALMPPGEGGGGEGDQSEKKPEKKKEDKKKDKKTVVKEPRQVENIKRDEPVETELATTGGGGGDGEGEGPNVGPSTGGGGGGGTCDPLVDPNQCQPPITHTRTCGDGIKEAPEQCDDGNVVDGDKCSSTCKVEQILLPPNIFAGMRISGETQIMPPDPVKTEMLRDGKERTTGSFKLCIDTGGRVASIAPIGGGTKYPAYDSKITATARAWLYKPYTVNNQGAVTAVPACSVVTFVYTIK